MISAAGNPSGSADMNTMPLVESVTLSANDMMLPLSVMKVMPTATQPMNDVVFSSENRLTAVKKPGVVATMIKSANKAATRMATSTRPRRELGNGKRHASRHATAKPWSVMSPLLPDG